VTIDNQFDDDQQPGGEPLDENIRRELRQARDTKRELEETQARLAVMEKDTAFTKAGLPEDGPAALLRQTYTGPLDPEAIKAEAAKYGITPSGGAPAGGEYDEELSAMRQATGTVRGTGGDPTPDPLDVFHDSLKATRKEFRPGSPGSDQVAKDRVIAALEDLQAAGAPIRIKVQGTPGDD
jgi:hypothetical protein